MSKHRWNCTCMKDRRCRYMCTVCFGLGMSLSCFCPMGFTLFIAAVIMVALGVSLLKA